jgi:hypothetical protein
MDFHHITSFWVIDLGITLQTLPKLDPAGQSSPPAPRQAASVPIVERRHGDERLG